MDFFLYLVIAIYLDLVLPREYGLRRHPLFCLQRKTYKSCCRVSPAQRDEQTEGLRDAEDKEHIEDVDANLKALEKTNDFIEISRLKKVYDTGKVAVNELSLKLYLGQIFALLGTFCMLQGV